MKQKKRSAAAVRQARFRERKKLGLNGKRKQERVSDSAVAASKFKRGKQGAVFSFPVHPPGVGKGAGLAQDSNLNTAASWANQALGSFWVEGTTFLGYAYLSELAQRPEYRVICETIATEMTRKGWRFTSKGDADKTERIGQLDDEFKRLRVRDLFCRATEQDGFFGRGHIYIDTGATDDVEELKKPIGDGWDRISKAKIGKKNPIQALRTVEAVWCYPTSYNSNDPLKGNWYRPDNWYVQAKIVHASRIITFIGREVPDLLKPTYSFGGLSLSQLAKPYVDNFLRNRQSSSDILNSFSVFNLATNLSESLQGDGQQLFNRAEVFNNYRNNAGLLLTDKDSEEFKNIAAPITGVSDILTKSQEFMCFPAHAPLVKLWGLQPAGLNADSDGVMRSFYDYIGAYQEHLFRDKLHRLMGLVMLSLWDETDEDIGFEFEPLWALDEKAKAEVEKLKAETGQILVDDGALAPAEERARVAADTGSDYSTIDVDDVPDLLEEEQEGLEPTAGAARVLEAEVEEGEGPGAKRKAA